MSEFSQEPILPPPFQPAQQVAMPIQQQDVTTSAIPTSFGQPATDVRQFPLIQLSKEDLVIRTFFNDAMIGPKLKPY